MFNALSDLNKSVGGKQLTLMPSIGIAEAVRYIVMWGWSSRLYPTGPEVEKEVGVEGRSRNTNQWQNHGASREIHGFYIQMSSICRRTRQLEISVSLHYL